MKMTPATVETLLDEMEGFKYRLVITILRLAKKRIEVLPNLAKHRLVGVAASGALEAPMLELVKLLPNSVTLHEALGKGILGTGSSTNCDPISDVTAKMLAKILKRDGFEHCDIRRPMVTDIPDDQYLRYFTLAEFKEWYRAVAAELQQSPVEA